MSFLLFIGPLGPFEILIILFVGLLIFGARLPEVGRSLGKGLMEFKRGLRGMQDELGDIDREADRQVDDELERRAIPTNPAEEEAAFHGDDVNHHDDVYLNDGAYEDEDEALHEDDLAAYDPRVDDEDTGETYDDDPHNEPGPEFGGDPQPDADPPAPSSTDTGTTVYVDPDYLGDAKKDD